MTEAEMIKELELWIEQFSNVIDLLDKCSEKKVLKIKVS